MLIRIKLKRNLSIGISVLTGLALRWKLRSQLTAENIKEISLDDAVLETDEFTEVISLIRKSEFDKTNRVEHGPTPVVIITIVFIDGIKINVGYWGGTTFELSPTH